MLARGQGAHGTLEARRLRGLVEQNTSEYRVWSIEYREMHRFGWQVAAPGGGWRAENIFGSQVSAVGYRVRVFRFGFGNGLNLHLASNI